MNEYALLKVNTDNSVDLIELPTPDVTIDLLHSVCQPFDFARSQLFRDTLICIDAEGKEPHKQLPLNLLASLVYSYDGTVLVGDVLLGTDFIDDPNAELDFYAYSLKRANYIRERLLGLAFAVAGATASARQQDGLKGGDQK